MNLEFFSATFLGLILALVECLSVSDQCLIRCVQDFIHGIQIRFDATEFDISAVRLEDLLKLPHVRAELQSERDAVENICREYRTMNQCLLDKCPEKLQLQMVTNAWNTIDFICVQKYADFVAHLPCVHFYFERIVMECRSEYNISLLHLRRILKEHDTDENLLRDALDQFCVRSSEAILCVVPEISKQCGEQAGLLFEQIFFMNYQNVNQLLEKLQLPIPLPDRCKGKPIDAHQVRIDVTESYHAISREHSHTNAAHSVFTIPRTFLDLVVLLFICLIAVKTHCISA